MVEKKVRRTIYFNDIEKAKRFVMLYEDLFQTLVHRSENDKIRFSGSSMKGFEYDFVFHMSKENFDMLRKGGIVKKLRQHEFKERWMSGYKKDIWVLQ